MNRCRFEVLLQNDMTGGTPSQCILDAEHEGDHLSRPPEHPWFEPYVYMEDEGD